MKIAYRFFRGQTLSSEVLTCYELWEKAAGLAYMIERHGLSNERILLICKSQRNFVVAFFACLLGGMVAVPTAPPRRHCLLRRLQLIANDARARAVIYDCDDMQDAELNFNGQPLLKLDLRSTLQGTGWSALATRFTPRFKSGEDIAFLQYTSGSTGDPKGVAISHDNLLCNCKAMGKGFAFSRESSVLTALPLYHDMGLVLGVLQAMYSGCIANFLSPAEFAQYPERWLQIISTFKVTISGGPNFVYELAARVVKCDQIHNIDLSSWRVAFCGAEPVRFATISRFAKRFETFGFKPQAFNPAYGLAESTLFVTANHVGTLPSVCSRNGREIVGCGVPRNDTHIEIVDPVTLQRVAEGDIGEIWVTGSSIAKGYWMRAELTKQVFRAHLADDDRRDFLRTGDLGFSRNGELYISGRLKDVIIINGNNYAPHDIEDEAEGSHSGLQPAGGAAFGVTQDGYRATSACI